MWRAVFNPSFLLMSQPAPTVPFDRVEPLFFLVQMARLIDDGDLHR
jgi:hypothetical protein